MFVILMFDALKPLADSGCEFLFILIRKYFDTIRRANLRNIKRFYTISFPQKFSESILDKASHVQFPELDRLWFTVRCWNVGIRLYIANHVIEAEKWCALALRLLAQLERFKENYETQVSV